MLINYANYCETKPKRIFIKVKIWKDTCLLGEKNYFLPKIGYSWRQTTCFLTFLNIIGAVGNYKLCTCIKRWQWQLLLLLINFKSTKQDISEASMLHWCHTSQLNFLKTYWFQCPIIKPLKMKNSFGILKTHKGNCEQFGWKRDQKAQES